MVEYIKNHKASYMVYNFFNKKRLSHNIALYRKYGLKKKYYSPISSADFVGLEDSFKRMEDKEAIRNSEFFKAQGAENQKELVDFYKNGYCKIKAFIDEDTVDSINREVEMLQASGRLKFRYGNKLMFAIHHSALIKSLGEDVGLKGLLNVLFDGRAKLFQSINFIMGSQQKTHSDSIHMTTFPLGGLLGVWIALDDVDKDNGALHYYPGSHRLPYFMNSDYGNEGTRWMLGDKGYTAYEEMLGKEIQRLSLEKEIFTAKKGDMLIWHANILHGGEPHLDTSRTRRSMVFHYFDENAICYHEVTQRPALFS